MIVTHPFTQFRGARVLKPIPALTGQEVGASWTGHQYMAGITQSFTPTADSRSVVHLTSTSLDCARGEHINRKKPGSRWIQTHNLLPVR